MMFIHEKVRFIVMTMLARLKLESMFVFGLTFLMNELRENGLRYRHRNLGVYLLLEVTARLMIIITLFPSHHSSEGGRRQCWGRI